MTSARTHLNARLNQVIILARVITGEDHVIVMARGIEILYNLLQCDNYQTQELAANSIASLAHTRAGYRLTFYFFYFFYFLQPRQSTN